MIVTNEKGIYLEGTVYQPWGLGDNEVEHRIEIRQQFYAQMLGWA